MVNKDNMRKVTQAMRSETYDQTAGYLRDHVGFCGLGVISDVSGVGQWMRHDLREGKAYYEYVTPCDDRENPESDAAGLIPSVMDWLGLERDKYGWHADDLDLYDEDGQPASITDLNDEKGYDFHRIAALIEKRYEL